MITQQLIVDNEVLAVLVYHIERVTDASRPAPAMEIIGVQKYPWRGPSHSSSTPASSPFHMLGSSPPVSPSHPTFGGHLFAAGTPLPPHSPIAARASVPGGSLPAGVENVDARMVAYSYSMSSPYGFHP